MLLVSTSTENNKENSLSVDISMFIKVHNMDRGNCVLHFGHWLLLNFLVLHHTNTSQLFFQLCMNRKFDDFQLIRSMVNRLLPNIKGDMVRKNYTALISNRICE